MQLSNGKSKAVVLGVDVGTSNIRCYAYDRYANVIGKAEGKINLLNLGDGNMEMVPETLWENFKTVVKNCLLSSHLHASDVACLGISTQRGTFLTWDRETGEPFHNFISWKDTRAKDICDRWNSSFLLQVLKYGAFLLYILTWQTKFQVYSNLKFSSAMVLMRLYWILQHYPEIRQKSVHNRVLFGTIDTWLLWKLTGGKMHATDTSNASATGLFDPFKMQWIGWILKILCIPENILPVVKNTCDSYGETLPCIFGSAIRMGCLVGDQQASMYGACCFEEYDINCTLGTGSFLNVNTGLSPSTSSNGTGVIPLVGWTIHSKTTYIAECRIHDTGNVISWMQNLGLFQEPHESSHMAQSVTDSGGVCFLPAQNPLQVSEKGDSSFVGLRTTTSKEQVVHSVLEALAFQVCLLFEAVCQLFGHKMKVNVFCICGGVAKNDFIVQTLSNITAQQIHRLKHAETSSLGAAFLAGLHYGIWKSQEELKEIRKEYAVFSPTHSDLQLASFRKWKKCLTPVYHSTFPAN